MNIQTKRIHSSIIDSFEIYVPFQFVLILESCAIPALFGPFQMVRLNMTLRIDWRIGQNADLSTFDPKRIKLIILSCPANHKPIQKCQVVSG